MERKVYINGCMRNTIEISCYCSDAAVCNEIVINTASFIWLQLISLVSLHCHAVG